MKRIPICVCDFCTRGRNDLFTISIIFFFFFFSLLLRRFYWVRDSFNRKRNEYNRSSLPRIYMTLPLKRYIGPLATRPLPASILVQDRCWGVHFSTTYVLGGNIYPRSILKRYAVGDIAASEWFKQLFFSSIVICFTLRFFFPQTIWFRWRMTIEKNYQSSLHRFKYNPLSIKMLRDVCIGVFNSRNATTSLFGTQ